MKRVGEGEFEHMQRLTTRLETEKRDLNQEEETELIEVYKCRESKFTWKSLIAMTFGDLETRTFMPQVTGQSMVLEMGMDARGRVENFGLKAGATGETELTDMAIALENHNMLEACKYIWTPAYVYEGGTDFEADMTAKLQEAKVQWGNNLYSGNKLTAVFKNKTYLNLYQGGANKKPRQPERIMGDMKRHFENEQCVQMANKVQRYHRTKAGNMVIIKSKLGAGEI